MDSGKKVEFLPNTGYYLPVIYAITGQAVETLDDMAAVIDKAEKLISPPPAEKLWLPYLGETLDNGMAALWLAEIIEALKYVGAGPAPVDGIWLGAADDIIMRQRGVEFVDGSAPGFAAVTGAAPDVETAVALAREMQGKILYVFIAGESRGTTFAEQLIGGGVDLAGSRARALRPRDLRPHLLGRLRDPRRHGVRRRQAGRLQGHAHVQQGPGLRVRARPGRGGRPQVRGRGGRHQLRLPDHRRDRHPGDPAHGRLHLRARVLGRGR